VLYRFAGGDGTRHFDALLERGVLVRDFSAVPRLDGALRVSVGSPRDNDAFLAATESVLECGYRP
jgi:histidinol-phosphate aminotransferase